MSALAALPLRLLIAGPLPTTTRSLPAALRGAGATVLCCAADDAVRDVRIDEPDLVLADPSRVDSWRAVVALRRVGHAVGVVLLTGEDVGCDRVEIWLDAADDLLIGTLNPREIIAHCRAVDRRRRGHASAELVVRGVGVDPRSCAVVVGDQRFQVTKSERDILAALLRRAGNVVRRETLMLELYGDEEGAAPKIVDVFLCKLRRRLASAGAPPDLIETVWGEGLIIRREGAPAAAHRRAA